MKILLIALLSFVEISSFASDSGTSTAGDGGHGVLCRYQTARETYADYQLELLDLYESRIHFGPHRLSYFDQNIDDGYSNHSIYYEICKVFAVMKHQAIGTIGNPEEITSAFDHACALAAKIEFKTKLPRTLDHGIVHLPIARNCRVVQVGYRTYVNGSEKVYIDEFLSQFLSIREFAALLLHETLHAYAGKQSSTEWVRELVGYFFAKEEFQIRNRDLIIQVINSKQAAPLSSFVK